MPVTDKLLLVSHGDVELLINIGQESIGHLKCVVMPFDGLFDQVDCQVG